MIGNIQANWGLHVFSLNSNQLRPIISGLELSSELQVEEQEALKGMKNLLLVKDKTKDRTFKLKTETGRMFNSLSNPLAEYNAWVNDIGDAYPFLIDYVSYGGWTMKLKKVAMDSVKFAPTGEISYCQFELEFFEDRKSGETHTPAELKSNLPEQVALLDADSIKKVRQGLGIK